MVVEGFFVLDQRDLTPLGKSGGEQQLVIIDMLAQVGAAGDDDRDRPMRLASMIVAGPPWHTTAGALQEPRSCRGSREEA